MIVAYDGSAIRVEYTATVNGALADPTTTTVSIRSLTGIWGAPVNMTRDSLGTFHFDYQAPDAGYYGVLVQTTGPSHVEFDGIAILAV